MSLEPMRFLRCYAKWEDKMDVIYQMMNRDKELKRNRTNEKYNNAQRDMKKKQRKPRGILKGYFAMSSSP